MSPSAAVKQVPGLIQAIPSAARQLRRVLAQKRSLAGLGKKKEIEKCAKRKRQRQRSAADLLAQAKERAKCEDASLRDVLDCLSMDKELTKFRLHLPAAQGRHLSKHQVRVALPAPRMLARVQATTGGPLPFARHNCA